MEECYVKDNKLVTFLYLLMRDELHCGAVERIVQEIENTGKDYFVLSNGYLADYAYEIAERLLNNKKE